MNKKIILIIVVALVIITPLTYVYIRSSADKEGIPDEEVTEEITGVPSDSEMEIVHEYEETPAQMAPASGENADLPEEEITVQHTGQVEEQTTLHGYEEPTTAAPE